MELLTELYLRRNMPQITQENVGKFFDYLAKNGVKVKIQVMEPEELIPSQEINPQGVWKMLNNQNAHKRRLPVWISSGKKIIDGHHRWSAQKTLGEPIKVFQVNKNLRDALRIFKAFDGVVFKDNRNKVVEAITEDKLQQFISERVHSKNVMDAAKKVVNAFKSNSVELDAYSDAVLIKTHPEDGISKGEVNRLKKVADRFVVPIKISVWKWVRSTGMKLSKYYKELGFKTEPDGHQWYYPSNWVAESEEYIDKRYEMTVENKNIFEENLMLEFWGRGKWRKKVVDIFQRRWNIRVDDIEMVRNLVDKAIADGVDTVVTPEEWAEAMNNTYFFSDFAESKIENPSEFTQLIAAFKTSDPTAFVSVHSKSLDEEQNTKRLNKVSEQIKKKGFSFVKLYTETQQDTRVVLALRSKEKEELIEFVQSLVKQYRRPTFVLKDGDLVNVYSREAKPGYTISEQGKLDDVLKVFFEKEEFKFTGLSFGSEFANKMWGINEGERLVSDSVDQRVYMQEDGSTRMYEKRTMANAVKAAREALKNNDKNKAWVDVIASVAEKFDVSDRELAAALKK